MGQYSTAFKKAESEETHRKSPTSPIETEQNRTEQGQKRETEKNKTTNLEQKQASTKTNQATLP
jgi:hypothetical protein